MAFHRSSSGLPRLLRAEDLRALYSLSAGMPHSFILLDPLDLGKTKQKLYSTPDPKRPFVSRLCYSPTRDKRALWYATTALNSVIAFGCTQGAKQAVQRLPERPDYFWPPELHQSATDHKIRHRVDIRSVGSRPACYRTVLADVECCSYSRRTISLADRRGSCPRIGAFEIRINRRRRQYSCNLASTRSAFVDRSNPRHQSYRCHHLQRLTSLLHRHHHPFCRPRLCHHCLRERKHF